MDNFRGGMAITMLGNRIIIRNRAVVFGLAEMEIAIVVFGRITSGKAMVSSQF